MTQNIKVRSRSRTELIDITGDVNRCIEKSGISRGICTIYVPHTTAAVTINENADPSVKKDILSVLEKLIPAVADYKHAEGNSDAHVKAGLMGANKTVIIENGSLKLGRWQGIFFCEFDGPRAREAWITLMAEV